MQFLTRIPINKTLDVTEEDFGQGLAFAPLVGLIIGLLLYVVYWVGNLLLPLPIVAIIIVVTYIIISGGIHLDGLGDTFDGIFSGRSKGRVMEIMKDSTSGTFGVLALISVIIIDASCVYFLLLNGNVEMIILFPIIGRMTCLIGSGLFKYAREDGLGKSFVNHCGVREIIIGFVFTLISFYIIGGIKYMLLVIAMSIIAYLINLYFSKKIDGITGDIIGASCELNQMTFLLVAVMLTVTF